MRSLNNAFIQQMTELLGPSETEALCRAICETPAVTSIRRNTRKEGHSPAGAPVPWCTTGSYLSERPQFTLDPLFHAGAYYVQEASSMFIEQAFHAITARESVPPHAVLDLCAAPGGKSTLWRSLLPEDCLLVANEPIRQRAQILAENMTKWGHPDVVVTTAFPEEFAPLGSFFDIIAADVPCSGEGMFRKDEQARSEWSPEAVTACAERQWQIISDVWPALREGGYLVYSTCTFNAEEDERMVQRICQQLGASIVAIPHNKAWGIVEGKPGYHFYPHRTKGEGIYMALLQKTSPAPERKSNKKEKKGKKSKDAATSNVHGSSTVARWLCNAEHFKIFSPDEGFIGAVNQSLFDDIKVISSTVRTLTAGILLAEEKGKKLIPQHALALSIALAQDAFPQEEVSRETALAYLRREAITLSPDSPRGYVIVTYGSLPLGFVNNLGTRANNLYPEQWRIRHQ